MRSICQIVILGCLLLLCYACNKRESILLYPFNYENFPLGEAMIQTPSVNTMGLLSFDSFSSEKWTPELIQVSQQWVDFLYNMDVISGWRENKLLHNQLDKEQYLIHRKEMTKMFFGGKVELSKHYNSLVFMQTENNGFTQRFFLINEKSGYLTSVTEVAHREIASSFPMLMVTKKKNIFFIQSETLYYPSDEMIIEENGEIVHYEDDSKKSIVAVFSYDQYGRVRVKYQIRYKDTYSEGKYTSNAEFDGDLMTFVKDSLVYPSVAEGDSLRGRVIVSFIIDENCTVLNPKVLRGLREDYDSSALNLVNKMHFKQPFYWYQKPVSAEYIMPIVF